MKNWKMTRVCAILWFVTAGISILTGDWEGTATAAFAGVGWFGWSVEEEDSERLKENV
jgi:hypothetical protein